MEERVSRSRKKISLGSQVRVLYRDKWLCHLCGYPTVFPLAMKYLQRMVEDEGGPAASLPAYYHFRYRHDEAPMLDYLACVIDHRIAHARGGAGEDDNLVTACNKCNVRKNDKDYVAYVEANPRRKVKGKYGSLSDGTGSHRSSWVWRPGTRVS